MAARRTRARVFGEVAELYERRRPGYPAALYDDLLTLVGSGGRVLEAGAGTGRATVELARRGLSVVAFEPDPAMAAVARDAAHGLPVQIEQRPFEEWHDEWGSFDLVVSAQAWHWVDQERASAIARRALRAGGLLAIWWNQAGPSHGPIREALDDAYGRHAPELQRSVVNRPVHALDADSLRIDGFQSVQRRSYSWSERYDAVTYTELLQTHSDHRMLAPDRLDTLLQAVAAAIEQCGGELVYPYRTDLLTARAKK